MNGKITTPLSHREKRRAESVLDKDGLVRPVERPPPVLCDGGPERARRFGTDRPQGCGRRVVEVTPCRIKRST